MSRYASKDPVPLSKIAYIDDEAMQQIVDEIPDANWGNIGGTLSAQTDLSSALAGKSATGHTHSYEPANANIQFHIASAHLQFSGLAKITVGATEPTNPSEGDIWIQTT